MNNSNFLHYWFNGFENSLQDLSGQERNTIFKHCGKACSDSYTKQIYIDEFNRSTGLSDFLGKLKNRFPEIEFTVLDEYKILLSYHYCACDLVKNNFIKSPLLCECSRQSLLHNWNTIYGENNVDIAILHSILNGDNACQFEITIKSLE